MAGCPFPGCGFGHVGAVQVRQIGVCTTDNGDLETVKRQSCFRIQPFPQNQFLLAAVNTVDVDILGKIKFWADLDNG